MCTSPLIRYRAKRQDAGTFLASSTNWMIKSAKELESYFKSYSDFRLYMDNYMDYQYIPCRRCNECKINYAQEWSIRCYHEFQVRKIGCFLTLTIDSNKCKLFLDDAKKMKRYCKGCKKGSRYFKYPPDYTLLKGWFLDELKRIRDVLLKRYCVKVRYFGCGEYGELDDRPHYHLLLFGYNFMDRVYWKKSSKGIDTYLSEELSDLWPYGIAMIEEINYRACMYVAKYVTKKLKYYDDQVAFENYYGREPEFIFMSKGNCQSNRCIYLDDIIKNCKGLNSLRNLNNPYCKYCEKTRGGLGYDWFLRYKDDVLKKGYITINGIKYDIPSYYLDILKLTDREKYDSFKLQKLIRMRDEYEEHPEELSSERMFVRAEVLKSKLSKYHRS